MSITHNLANEAISCALRCSKATVEAACQRGLHLRANMAEIELITACINKGMVQEDQDRAFKTIQALKEKGRRFTFATSIEVAA